jgi:hypothetical protein
MQRLLQWMRHLVFPAAAILLLWAGYQVLADSYISDAAGRILVVYNAEETLADTALADPDLRDCSKLTPDIENSSDQALVGICNAFIDQKKQGRAPLIDLLNLHDNTAVDQNLNSGKVYEQLSAKVARGSLLGVISLLTSPDSEAVVRFCRSMQIPLLLAIAANDDLLSPAEDTGGLVFRAIPTNKEQAKDIVEWMKQQKLESVAMFHEPNSFGEYLFRQINSLLKNQQDFERSADSKTSAYAPVIFQYEVRAETEFSDLMRELWCDQIDGIVYLGFASRATDLLNKVKWYRTDPDTTNCEVVGKRGGKSRTFDSIKVLLSSGAYQQDLDDIRKFRFRFDAYVMSPTKRNPPTPKNLPVQPSDSKALVASAQYGYDSYKLMVRLASTTKGKGNGALRTIFSDPSLDSKTGHKYEFDESGELKSGARNRYCGYELASSRQETTPRSKP